MAKFNVDQPDQQAPNFMNYSQGRRGNQALGTLFEGIGQVGEGVVKIADTNIKNNLYKEAEGAVDQVRNLFGTDDGQVVGTAQNIPDGGKIPPEISQSKNYLERLAKGYQNGTVKSSYYYGNLQSVVKSLKAKYPGYEQEVDNTIQSITGVTPANAIISSLRQEAEEAGQQARSEANRQETFINQNLPEVLESMPDYMQNPEKYSWDQIRANVGQVQLRNATVRNTQADLALRAAQKSLTEDDVYDAATKVSSEIGFQIMNGGFNTLGATYEEITKTLQAGGVPSPEKMQEMTLALNQAILTGKQTIEKTLRANFDDSNPSLGSMHSFLSKDPKKLEAVTKAALQPLEDLKNAITSGDISYAAASAAYTKAVLDQDVARIVNDPGNEILRRIQAVNAIGGQQGTQVFLQNSANATGFSTTLKNLKLPPAGKILFQDNFNKVDLGEAGDVTTDVEKLAEQGSASSKVGKSLPGDVIKGHISRVTSGDDPVQVANSVNYLFASGPDKTGLNINKLRPSQRSTTFASMTTPAVAKAVRASGNQEAWNNYTNWVSNNYHAHARTIANDIKSTNEYVTNGVSVTLDPNTGRLNVQDNQAARRNAQIKSGKPNALSDSTANMATSQLVEQYRQLNLLTTGLISVADQSGDKGRMGPELIKQFKLLGLDIQPTASGSPDERGEAKPKNLLDDRPNTTVGISDRDLSDLEGDLVKQNQSGAAIRTKPLSESLKGVLNRAASAGGVQVSVFSGGQPKKGEGGKRTGSTRHDHGNAADVHLKDAEGRTLDFNDPDDLPQVIAFVQEAIRNGATGVGAGPGYMDGRSLHIGYGRDGKTDGPVETWGKGGNPANTPKWLRDAVAEVTSGNTRMASN